MNPTYSAVILVVYHFVCDWLLQSRYIAKNKSTKLSALGLHLLILYLGLQLAVGLMGYNYNVYTFGLITFYIALHGVQDWFIWRGYAKFFHKEDVPTIDNKMFWNTIAVDQIIHLVLLMLLFL